MEQFWVIRDGERSGPFSEAEILRAYRNGDLQPTDHLWAQGVSTPVTVAEAFSHLLGRAPPEESELTLVAVPEPSGFADAEDAASPYRPPHAAVDARSELRADAEVRYAGFWVRLSANVLDGLIVGLLTFALAVLLAVATSFLGIGFLESEWMHFALPTALVWLYVALGESGPYSATWGKRAFHLQVLGASYLDRISFLRASARFVGRYLSTLLLMLGYLMQPFNARKRALHDFLSGTVVLVERQYSRVLVALMIAITIAIPIGIGFLALPSYQHYALQRKVSAALRQARPATVAIEQYLNRTGQAPSSLEQAGFAARGRLPGVRGIAFDPNSGVITVTLDFEPVAGNTVLIVPKQIDNGKILWDCKPGTLQRSLLPPVCPPQA